MFWERGRKSSAFYIGDIRVIYNYNTRTFFKLKTSAFGLSIF